MSALTIPAPATPRTQPTARVPATALVAAGAWLLAVAVIAATTVLAFPRPRFQGIAFQLHDRLVR